MIFTDAETNQLRTLRRAIGANIHNLRIKRKMTLRKCSRLSGVNPEMLDQYELGKNHISVEELLKLALTFDVGLEALLKVSQ